MPGNELISYKLVAFRPPNSPLIWVLVSFPLYKWGNWRSGRPHTLPGFNPISSDSTVSCPKLYRRCWPGSHGFLLHRSKNVYWASTRWPAPTTCTIFSKSSVVLWGAHYPHFTGEIGLRDVNMHKVTQQEVEDVYPVCLAQESLLIMLLPSDPPVAVLDLLT